MLESTQTIICIVKYTCVSCGSSLPHAKIKFVVTLFNYSYILSVIFNIFFPGKASHDVDNPDFVPSLHMGYDIAISTPQSDLKLSRYQRVKARRQLLFQTIQDESENDRHAAASALMDLASNCDADNEGAYPDKPASDG